MYRVVQKFLTEMPYWEAFAPLAINSQTKLKVTKIGRNDTEICCLNLVSCLEDFGFKSRLERRLY